MILVQMAVFDLDGTLLEHGALTREAVFPFFLGDPFSITIFDIMFTSCNSDLSIRISETC